MCVCVCVCVIACECEYVTVWMQVCVYLCIWDNVYVCMSGVCGVKVTTDSGKHAYQNRAAVV